MRELPGVGAMSIADLVVRRLEEAGIPDAAADSLDASGPLDGLARWPQGAVLHVHPYPGIGVATGAIPTDWIETASTWLAGHAPSRARLAAAVEAFQFEAAIEDAGALLAAAAGAGANCLLVHGDAHGHVQGIHLHHRAEPALLLAIGGRAADLGASVRALQDLGRRIAQQAAYACISVEPTLAALWHGAPTVASTRGEVTGLVRKLADEVALDAFCWQVLTARHLDRLGGSPHDERSLPAVEVAVGDVEDWLPGSPTTDTVRARARILLDGVLVGATDAARMLRARRDATDG